MPSIQDIADQTGFCRHTVGKALRLLQDEGAVGRTPWHGLAMSSCAGASMISGYPDPASNAAPASAKVADNQPALATAAPTGYLDVAALDFVPWRELAGRHAWLLEQIRAAGTGQDVRLPGIRAAALALVAVLAELDLRARGYKAAADHQYWCACGFACIGMAAFDEHLDPYPPGSPASDIHHEVTEEFATQQTAHAAKST